MYNGGVTGMAKSRYSIALVGALAVSLYGCNHGKKLSVKLVNMIPLSLSGESNQDSEPFLAISRSNRADMAGTAFTPNPLGIASGLAPIYVSENGGDTWKLNMIVPSAGALTGTGDITVAGGKPPARLYGSILRIPGSLLMTHLRTNDFRTTTPMTILASRSQADQPFVQSASALGINNRVYIGNNDFNAPGGRTATVDVSLDAGASFNLVRIESRATMGQDGPSIRPAIARDGTVYAAYFGWRSFSGSLITSDVVVVRDDSGGGGSTPFQDLKDPTDGLSGSRVVRNVTIPWSNAPTLGFERIGSTLSMAVDPNHSEVVYVAWADRVGTGDIYTIHVRRSTDRGVTWSGDLRKITNATCVSLAIANNKTVGLLYQQFAGGRWVTRLEQTRDEFATRVDTVLANVPGNQPPLKFLPYIGDYNFLLASGGKFHGIFSANNKPNMANFPSGVKYQRRFNDSTQTLLDLTGNTVAVSIDPFYFSVSAIP